MPRKHETHKLRVSSSKSVYLDRSTYVTCSRNGASVYLSPPALRMITPANKIILFHSFWTNFDFFLVIYRYSTAEYGKIFAKTQNSNSFINASVFNKVTV